ncbi:hypothetical protein [Aporhodopirellula aestuarii]|uniref:Uncharacterized protein n=1 Tax=Aporhodopirellula aestuarii TaxID=2950107 RepID=A0ABT0UAS6_9BACT|nr:hypothetical protein [Aporhodopirellula aestuarii]MCM2373809.1 hypothetical protein [Aporhodopirellula aestuarii]
MLSIRGDGLQKRMSDDLTPMIEKVMASKSGNTTEIGTQSSDLSAARQHPKT